MRKTILRYIAVWAIVLAIYAVMSIVSDDSTLSHALKGAVTAATTFILIWGLLINRPRYKLVKENPYTQNADNPKLSDTSDSPTVEKMVELYGEPSATIVTDGTRGMSSDSTVLIYDKGETDNKGFLVYNGLKIDKANIVDMTFHRDERPLYKAQDFTFPERFEIILNTTDDENPKVFINAGHDLELAKETLVMLRQYLS